MVPFDFVQISNYVKEMFQLNQYDLDSDTFNGLTLVKYELTDLHNLEMQFLFSYVKQGDQIPHYYVLVSHDPEGPHDLESLKRFANDKFVEAQEISKRTSTEPRNDWLYNITR